MVFRSQSNLMIWIDPPIYSYPPMEKTPSPLSLFFHDSFHAYHHDPLYDFHVLSLIHDYNNFDFSDQWRQILDLKIKYLYQFISPCLRVWQYVCKTGHLEMFEKLRLLPRLSWHRGLESACSGGQLDIITRLYLYVPSPELLQSPNHYAPICNLFEGSSPHKRAILNHFLSCQRCDEWYKKSIIPQEIFYSACLGGDIQIIKWICKEILCRQQFPKSLENGYDLNLILEASCRSGKMPCVQHIINSGATGWYKGLKGACQGGHESLVTMMISKIRYCPYPRMIPLFQLKDNYYWACRSGNLNVVHQIVELSFFYYPHEDLNWSDGVLGACQSHQANNVKYLQHIIRQKYPQFRHRRHGDKFIHEFIHEFGDELEDQEYNWDIFLSEVCSQNATLAVDFFLKLGATNLNQALINALKNGFYQLSWKILNIGKAINYSFQWENLFPVSCCAGDSRLFHSMWQVFQNQTFKKSIKKNIYITAWWYALQSQNEEIIEIMQKKI